MADTARIFGKLGDVQELADGYWRALEDLPISAVRAGLRECERTCRHFPRPTEIRDAATNHQKSHVTYAHAGPACEHCEGSTWLPRYCHGRDTQTASANTWSDPEVPCQRPHRHEPHPYYARCGCHASAHRDEAQYGEL